MTEPDVQSGIPQIEAKIDDPSLVTDLPASLSDECDKPEVIKILLKPERLNDTSVSFRLPNYEGQELRRGQKILFVIPKEFRGKVLREAILGHRKDSTRYGGYNESRRDPNGAYSKITALDSKSGEWIGWHDKYGSVKFAEPRAANDPEEENLHDFINCSGIVVTDCICVENVARPGRADALDINLAVSNIHYLILNFYPELDETTEQRTAVYTEGTTFSDLPILNRPLDRLTPKYGDYQGGDISVSRAGYPNAVPLNLNGWEPPFPVNFRPEAPAHFENGELWVDLEPGKNLRYAEVACGDTRVGKNGAPSRTGGARLNMGIRKRETGEILWFASNINVPPKAVLSGSLQDPDYITQPGDQLVLRSTAYHSTYVMAWRLTYTSPNRRGKNIPPSPEVESDRTETAQEVTRVLSEEEENARLTQLAIDKFFGEKDALLDKPRKQ